MPQDIHGLEISTASDAARRPPSTMRSTAIWGCIVPTRARASARCSPRMASLASRIASKAISPCCPTSRRTCRSRSRRPTPHAASPRVQRCASARMWRRSMPGSPATSIARSASWEEILAEHPHDVLAFRLAHFNNFWLGRPGAMRVSVERVMPKWSRALAAYGTILSCHCFALEECDAYAAAEPSGRAAVEIDPGDVWGTHAVAHIMEMQGRHREGIAWLSELERNWDGGNNLLHHLWWHRALFHLEQREFDAVLDLYDRRFRNLAQSADAGAARTSTSTCRMRPRCCFALSSPVSMSANAGARSPTRPSGASVIACRPSRCRTG